MELGDARWTKRLIRLVEDLLAHPTESIPVSRFAETYATRLSLKGFMRMMGQPYWRLRDYLRDGAQRRQRAQAHGRAGAWVQAAAAAEPTYGYRRVYQALRQRCRPIGRERVRQLMGELGLQPPPPSRRSASSTGARRRTRLARRTVASDRRHPVSPGRWRGLSLSGGGRENPAVCGRRRWARFKPGTRRHLVGRPSAINGPWASRAALDPE